MISVGFFGLSVVGSVTISNLLFNQIYCIVRVQYRN